MDERYQSRILTVPVRYFLSSDEYAVKGMMSTDIVSRVLSDIHVG